MKASLCILAALVVFASAQSCVKDSPKDLELLQTANAEAAEICMVGEEAKIKVCLAKEQAKLFADTALVEKLETGDGLPDKEMAELMEKILVPALACACPVITKMNECFNKIPCTSSNVYDVFENAESIFGDSSSPFPDRRRDAAFDQSANSASEEGAMDDVLKKLVTDKCPSLATILNPPTWVVQFAVVKPADFDKFSEEQLKQFCNVALLRISPPQSGDVCADPRTFNMTANDNTIAFDVAVVSSWRPATADLIIQGDMIMSYTNTNGTAVSTSVGVDELAQSGLASSSAVALWSAMTGVVALALFAL